MIECPGHLSSSPPVLPKVFTFHMWLLTHNTLCYYRMGLWHQITQQAHKGLKAFPPI